MLEERVKQKSRIKEISSPIYRDFRVGDVKHSLADISKAQNKLAYKPDYRINQGLDIAMDWYINYARK